MGKRFFLIFNVLLAVILTARFMVLCLEIRSTDAGESKRTAYQQTEIKRPVIRMATQYRPFFGLDSSASSPASGTLSKDSDDSQNHNELVLADTRLRVRGIFISVGKACAVFELFDQRKKKNSKISLEKVETGSSIKGFTVADIRPGVVTLRNETGNRIKLRIFKPL